MRTRPTGSWINDLKTAYRLICKAVISLGCSFIVLCIALMIWIQTRPSPEVTQIDLEYPFKSITYRDGKSIFINTSEGTTINDFYDMSIFNEFYSGMTLEQAMELYGDFSYKQLEMNNRDQIHGYIGEDITIEVICRKIYSSDGDDYQIAWFLRAKPQTSLTLSGLDPSVIELLPDELPKMAVSILAGSDILSLDVEDNEVTSISWKKFKQPEFLDVPTEHDSFEAKAQP